jgi:hypothetical protein
MLIQRVESVESSILLLLLACNSAGYLFWILQQAPCHTKTNGDASIVPESDTVLL